MPPPPAAELNQIDFKVNLLKIEEPWLIPFTKIMYVPGTSTSNTTIWARIL